MAGRCGHCKALKPDWIEAAGQLKDKVKLGAVDCDAEENKGVCGVSGPLTCSFRACMPQRWILRKQRAISTKFGTRIIVQMGAADTAVVVTLGHTST